jgi:hypothetical protein
MCGRAGHRSSCAVAAAARTRRRWRCRRPCRPWDTRDLVRRVRRGRAERPFRTRPTSKIRRLRTHRGAPRSLRRRGSSAGVHRRRPVGDKSSRRSAVYRSAGQRVTARPDAGPRHRTSTHNHRRHIVSARPNGSSLPQLWPGSLRSRGGGSLAVGPPRTSTAGASFNASAQRGAACRSVSDTPDVGR